jgi:ribulose-5-phosphate 4-epimerase/fuculose-1-phosphate aldolase
MALRKAVREMSPEEWQTRVDLAAAYRLAAIYGDFEGPATDVGERPRIVNDLGDKRILILRNHGLMTVGKTVGEAFVWMYRIETACRIQIDALALHRGRQGVARPAAPAGTGRRHGLPAVTLPR